MALIDTHTHLDSFARGGSLAEVLGRAAEAGVESMIAIGTAADDWDLYRDLAKTHPGQVHYSVGLHPCSVDEAWEESVARIDSYWIASESPGPVALGEIGLDRFHLPKDPLAAERIFKAQIGAFSQQLGIAKKRGCPVVIHSRGAFPECVSMIDSSGVDWSQVVFHCFSEGEDQIRQIARRGGFGSFTGILTYKKAEAVRSAAQAQGLDRLMLETDAPYLAPMPRRGEPNEPAYLRHTAEYAATLFGVGFDELAVKTTATARRFFRLRA